MGGGYNNNKLQGGGAGAGVGSTQVIISKTITADGLVGSSPAGYMIEIINTLETGGVAVNLDYGTTALGVDIDPAVPIGANGSNISTMAFNSSATEAGFDIYVSNNLVWGAASVDVYVILRKIK